jgi:UDP-N-acetylglucosamine--N-acetylmuramyl-(pentapeptide) pyrophosphoryl-undecaprenol N-acetylglucosamine transferase
LNLEKDIPVILVLGGSQGAQMINDAIIDSLAQLIERYQIIHQTGPKNLTETLGRARIVLENNPHAERYKPYDYLNPLALKMSYGVAKLVISRSGSTLFEIAASGIPSIVVPIPEKVSFDQRKNAYAYARTGAAIVIEQENLSPEIILEEVNRLMDNPTVYSKMKQSAEGFAKLDAAKKIAEEIIKLALAHEPY